MLRLYLSRTADGKMDARALLERALADRGVQQMPAVERAPGGKPYFPDRPELCFSLSHSGPWALCALGVCAYAALLSLASAVLFERAELKNVLRRIRRLRRA